MTMMITRKIYSWMVTGVLLVLPAPSLMADAGGDDTAGREEMTSAGPFGTSTVGYTPVLAHAIRPRSSETEHDLFGARERYCIGGPPDFDAPFDALPHGARLTRLDAWYFDESDENLEVKLFKACQPDAAPGAVEITELATLESNGDSGSGHQAVSSIGEDIDLESCAYYARIQLDDGVTCSEGFDLTIMKVRAEWRRQVSPAPGTPTFNDVPPSHLFFQQVEALAASGITGGCDANNFCPNEALTRAQMAAFLAKALGLHWGSF